MKPGRYILTVYLTNNFVDYDESDSAEFTIVEDPKIYSLNPNPVAVGRRMKIFGSGFTKLNTIVFSQPQPNNDPAAASFGQVEIADDGSLSFVVPSKIWQYGENKVNSIDGIDVNVDEIYSITVYTTAGGQITKLVQIVSPQVKIFDDVQGEILNGGDNIGFEFWGQGMSSVSLTIYSLSTDWHWEYPLGSTTLQGFGGWGFTLPEDINPGMYYFGLEDIEDGNVSDYSGIFTVPLPVQPVPALEVLTSGPALAYIGEGVILHSLAKGGTGEYFYSWEGIDVAKEGGGTIMGLFNSSGLKTVTLTVTSGPQTVTTQCQVYVPEASTEPKPAIAALHLVMQKNFLGLYSAAPYEDTGYMLPPKSIEKLKRVFAREVYLYNKALSKPQK